MSSFKVKSERVVFEAGPAGRFFKVLERVVELEGIERSQFIWPQGQSVIIVAFTPEGKAVLIKEPKFGVLRELYTFPAGTVEEGESPEDAAQRELREEAGFECSRIEQIGELYSLPDKTTGTHTVLIAEDAQKVSKTCEALEVILLDPEQVADYVRSGLLAIDISVAAFFMACNHLNRGY